MVSTTVEPVDRSLVADDRVSLLSDCCACDD